MKEPWQQTKDDLQAALPSHTFNTWIKPLNYRATEEGRFLIEVPNTFYRERIQKTYAHMIKAKLRQFTHNTDADVAFVIPHTTPRLPQSILDEVSNSARASHQTQQRKRQLLHLNPKYTFSSFVVGSNSQLAFAGAQSVVDAPGQKYNPLLLYGGVGLGKTHLLSAIGNEILKSCVGKRIVYRTAEQFVNELVSAIRYQKTPEFRKLYRDGCDALLIDDIQFFSRKERTQEEFFHTFCTLHEAGVQIVLTSDQLPHQIPDIDERLRSRFESGLICDIQPPDIETRMAILKKKALGYALNLSDEAITFIAETFTTNVRALESSLVRLSAFSSVSSNPLNNTIDLALVEKVFSYQRPSYTISIDEIQKNVAGFFGLSLDSLKSSTRQRIVARPRQIAMYFCRTLTSHSFPEIGQKFGGRDHTTVMHAVNNIEKLKKTCDETRQNLNSLESRFHR